MKYPAVFLEQLRRVTSVSAVIGARLPVRRHGREFQALCPFHNEKTPSFTINDEKGFYHCFGCGAHGDAIGFIKEYEGISYKEAIERLAAEAGLALPQPTAEAVQEDKRRRNLQDVCELACRWFEGQLAGSDGYAARSYLTQRGVNTEMIQRFRIGYAPDDRSALARALMSEGVSSHELIAAGLLIKPDDAQREPYARFRGRLMFPIRDGSSKVVAFGGRILAAQENAPKYLNSPETELFHKGLMLYNYDLARRAARDDARILVCEGYMDVIALAQAGIDAAVAPLGTAITESQLQQCWQLADEPVLCLDGDAAGQRAMNRAAELALPLLQPAKSLRFMLLPAGEDPDSLVRSEGKAAFLARSQSATPLVEQLCQPILSKQALTPEDRAGQESTLMQLVERIQNGIVKAHYREHVRQLFWQRKASARPSSSGQVNGQQPMRSGSRISTGQSALIPYLPGSGDVSSRKARAILRGFALLMHFEALRSTEEAEWFLAELDMKDAPLKALQTLAAAQMSTSTLNIDALMQTATPPVRLKLHRELLTLARHNGQPEAAFDPTKLWQQMLAAYRQACLMEEYVQAEREMAQSMTEDRWQRFSALKAELEALDAQQQAWQTELLLEESQD